MNNGRGGARPGAGRKPKALTYADEARALERKILDGLPDVVDKLLEQAKAGDIRSARYLIDRIFGRAPMLPAPPVEDRTLPYTEEELEADTISRNHKIALSRSNRERWQNTSLGPHFDDLEQEQEQQLPPLGKGRVGVGFKAEASSDQEGDCQPDTDSRQQAPLSLTKLDTSERGGGKGSANAGVKPDAPSHSDGEKTEERSRQAHAAEDEWPSWPDWNPHRARQAA